MLSTEGIKEAVAARHDEMVATRRDLHMHPEVAFEETRTAGIIAKRLRALGLEVREHIGRTGVMGVLRGGKAGDHARTLMIRADIDALPVQEANETDYRSQEP